MNCERAGEGYSVDKKIVIFGCGKLGHEAIETLGSDGIECFCDNSPELAGTDKYGKKVISFEELKNGYKNPAVMICADIRKGHAWQIARECEKNGIRDYFLYQTVREKEIFSKATELLVFLDDENNRKNLKCEMYIRKSEELQKQVNYLKRHIDISHIKPAGGKLREWQLMLVRAAAELFDKLKELNIKPFLFGGNLIGYVRHNGFVPWDDDIDFAMMRDDYERMKKFCRENMYTRKEFCGEEKSNKNVREELKEYYWSEGGGNEFNIHKPLADGSMIMVDLFAMDYYAQDYAFEDLMKVKEKVRAGLNDAMDDVTKRINCIQEALQKNRENWARESDHIYFGIDNMDILHTFHRGDWIPKEVVFPLKKILYEGEYFYVPNNAAEFLRYEYENIWELADDIGLPPHLYHMGNEFTDMESW